MTKTKERTVEEELREVEQEIESMERELAEREQPIVWGEVEAGELEAKERRRAILPRLITAARIKRLELLRRTGEVPRMRLRRTPAYPHMAGRG
jgi:sugar-specific transcriptional regulator TrmB